jgi:hypothetical protein
MYVLTISDVERNMTDFEKARSLLHEFKGNSYLFGTDVLPKVGPVVAVMIMWRLFATL